MVKDKRKEGKRRGNRQDFDFISMSCSTYILWSKLYLKPTSSPDDTTFEGTAKCGGVEEPLWLEF